MPIVLIDLYPLNQLPRCQQAMYDNCIDQFDAIGCNAAVNFCDSELSTGLRASGQSPSHQIQYASSRSRPPAQGATPTTSRRCVPSSAHPSSPHLTPTPQPCEGTTGLCYAENTAIAALLNTPSVRTLLGATAPHDFTACSAAVSARFRARLDKWGPPAAEAHVAGLLARGVRVLLYAGTLDWQCNWVANRRWVDALAWPRAEEWARGEWREWAVAGRAAGETKTAGALTFATVRGAGHMMSVFFLLACVRAEPCLCLCSVCLTGPARQARGSAGDGVEMAGSAGLMKSCVGQSRSCSASDAVYCLHPDRYTCCPRRLATECSLAIRGGRATAA